MKDLQKDALLQGANRGSGIIKMYATIKVPDSVDILTGKYRLMNGDTIIRESSWSITIYFTKK
ncbi:hypothetical protein [Elizabethkingia anophelis]|uniref:hypothetical protein n=1 Tax=Elizabethkingia anophelis TaxID=1117645 RepID=UPI00259B9A31|nr:hypothetical protein [Elizabethkingia anophelis]WJK01810.1 hypothetical protein QTN78_08830 [Elizabethkingia anophelis]